jgi:hypothetical protein
MKTLDHNNSLIKRDYFKLLFFVFKYIFNILDCRAPMNCSMSSPLPPIGLTQIPPPPNFVYVELSASQYNCTTPTDVFYREGKVTKKLKESKQIDNAFRANMNLRAVLGALTIYVSVLNANR